MTDEYFMQQALEQAKIAYSQNEVPVGAIIIDENKIIVSEAHNLRETNKNAIAHAEILAISIACEKLNRWRLQSCTLYVTLEPCFMCSGAIVLARIPRVVYGTKDPKTGAVASLANVLNNPKLNHQCIVDYGVLETESGNLLKDFFKSRRELKKVKI